MNHPLACPRTRFLEGGGYLTRTQKTSLTKIRFKRAVKADGPDGAVDSLRSSPRGTSPQPLGKPSVSHRSLDALRRSPCGSRAHKLSQPTPPARLKGEIVRGDTQRSALPSAARNIVT